MNAMKQKGVYW